MALVDGGLTGEVDRDSKRFGLSQRVGLVEGIGELVSATVGREEDEEERKMKKTGR